MPTLTPEQLAIITHCRDTSLPLIIDAKAGSGKTSTLLEVLPHLRGTTTLQAFNKAISEEIKTKASRLPFEVQLNLDIRTVHSHGLAAVSKAASGRKPQVSDGKCSFILKDLMKAELYPDDPLFQHTSKITQLVGLAKSSGFGLKSPYEDFPEINDDAAWDALAEHFGTLDDLVEDDDLYLDAIRLAKQVLRLSNQRLHQLDFDDMIYLPLLHNLPLATYDNVLLDEAQDINATRREMAFRSLKPGGRLIAVGDPNQAIYGFTGASATSLEDIRRRSNAEVLTLSICWRCDAEIIKSAQQQVPGIQARPGAPAGEVGTITWDESSSWLDSVPLGSAILCRLNKPNVAVALSLLRRGKPARIEGRDIGERLLSHVKKAEPRYAFVSMSEIIASLDVYAEEQERILLSRQRESAAAMLRDEVEAAQLLCERVIEQAKGDSFTALEQLIASLFQNDVPRSQFITLSSIHKSKGREWPTVYILGHDDYLPFHLAQKRGGWQLEQEYNLEYVAKTRAQNVLISVNGVQSALDKGWHRRVPSAPASIGAQPNPKPAAETPAPASTNPLTDLDLGNLPL